MESNSEKLADVQPVQAEGNDTARKITQLTERTAGNVRDKSGRLTAAGMTVDGHSFDLQGQTVKEGLKRGSRARVSIDKQVNDGESPVVDFSELVDPTSEANLQVMEDLRDDNYLKNATTGILVETEQQVKDIEKKA